MHADGASCAECREGGWEEEEEEEEAKLTALSNPKLMGFAKILRLLGAFSASRAYKANSRVARVSVPLARTSGCEQRASRACRVVSGRVLLDILGTCTRHSKQRATTRIKL